MCIPNTCSKIPIHLARERERENHYWSRDFPKCGELPIKIQREHHNAIFPSMHIKYVYSLPVNESKRRKVIESYLTQRLHTSSPLERYFFRSLLAHSTQQ